MLIVPCTLVFSVTKGFMTVEKKKVKNRVYSLINFKDCVLFPVLPKNAFVLKVILKIIIIFQNTIGWLWVELDLS